VKIDIIVVYIQRYERGHEVDFVPPITGIHLAAITPPGHSVRVIHQQVEPVRLDTDADLIAVSFLSGFAPEAYRLAAEFRRRGKTVVVGGPHATFSPDEVLRHFDSVVVGEAESAWPRLIGDAEAGTLRSRYEGEPSPMCGLPTPRYDLLPRHFFVTRVVQATRGCPFTCSFCRFFVTLWRRGHFVNSAPCIICRGRLARLILVYYRDGFTQAISRIVRQDEPECLPVRVALVFSRSKFQKPKVRNGKKDLRWEPLVSNNGGRYQRHVWQTRAG
jgi:hypothetical protein